MNAERSSDVATELPPGRVAELLEGGAAQVVDVREPYEWEAGRIAGASHIELAELPSRAADLDHERPLILYCRGGSRSGMAAEAMRSAGFDAYNMAGGLRAWVEEGLPLEPEGGEVADRGGLPPPP